MAAPLRRTLRFSVTPEEEHRVSLHARELGVEPEALVRHELDHLLAPGGAPAFLQARALTLQSRLETLQEQRALKDAERQHVARMRLAHEGVSPRVAAELDLRQQALAGEVAALDSKVMRYTAEIAELATAATSRRRRSPSTAFGTFAFVPALGVATPQLTTLGWGLVLLALAATCAYMLLKHAKGRRWNLGRADKDIVTSGPNAGSPKPPTTRVEGGVDVVRITHAFWTSRKVLQERIQYWLDQPDGLERLRQAMEEADFETVEPDAVANAGAEHADEVDENGIGTHGVVGVRILVATDDELAKVPPDILMRLVSKRSRRHLPTAPDFGLVHGGAGARDAPARAPTPIAPAAHANGGGAATADAPKRKRGRPRKETAPAFDDDELRSGGDA